ncbi:hypothetical protein HK104_000472 [Borealophlyctis nickersoniae]|nr:hypothetical protein HK104_000472 [Borealophlyctis nickersoniae]
MQKSWSGSKRKHSSTSPSTSPSTSQFASTNTVHAVTDDPMLDIENMRSRTPEIVTNDRPVARTDVSSRKTKKRRKSAPPRKPHVSRSPTPILDNGWTVNPNGTGSGWMRRIAPEPLQRAETLVITGIENIPDPSFSTVRKLSQGSSTPRIFECRQKCPKRKSDPVIIRKMGLEVGGGADGDAVENEEEGEYVDGADSVDGADIVDEDVDMTMLPSRVTAGGVGQNLPKNVEVVDLTWSLPKSVASQSVDGSTRVNQSPINATGQRRNSQISTHTVQTPHEYFASVDPNQVKKPELLLYLKKYLGAVNVKEMWIDRLRILLGALPQQLSSTVSIDDIVQTAPVFEVWSCDASAKMARTLLSRMSNLLKFSRAGGSSRASMAVNVSEARERIAFGTAKAIASYYLEQRQNGNMQAIEFNAEDAMNAEEAEDAQKNRKRAAEVEDAGDTSGKKRRSKFLKLSAEEIDLCAAKRDAKNATRIENPESTAETKSRSRSGKTNSSSDGAIRSISFRLFPSPELATGLLKWLDIADAMDAHVKELAESFAERGERFTPEFIRDNYIALSGNKYRSLEKAGDLGTLRDLERRRVYTSLPTAVQDRTIRTALAGFKSCQTKLEKGHINNFKTRPKDPVRRWKTLYFANDSMSVATATGEVYLYPRMDFVPPAADRGLYIRDALLRFLTPGSRAPTKHWGNHLLCGEKEGRAFESESAPFRPAALEEIMNNSDHTANRARKWIMRSDSLFGGNLSNGNTDVYPDVVTEMEQVYGEIALLQSRKDSATNAAGGGEGASSMRRRRKRERKKAAGIKKKWKRNWRPNIESRIRGLYAKLSARMRQAHGAFANHLVRNYDTVIMPEFMTAGMIRKRRKLLQLPPIREGGDGINAPPREGGFSLRKSTRKAMLWISHHQFRQRLLAKALADPNGKKDVILTTEEYTTKQCPFCGFVNYKIGGKKVFKCGNDQCGFVGGRDNTGAFNVCIRPVVKEEMNVEDSSIGVDGKERSKDGDDNEHPLRFVQKEQKEDRDVAIERTDRGDERVAIEDERIAIEDGRSEQSPLSHGSTASRSGHSEYLWPEVVMDEPEPIVEDAADVQMTPVLTPVNPRKRLFIDETYEENRPSKRTAPYSRGPLRRQDYPKEGGEGRPFVCPHRRCGKTYKNFNGLKYHLSHRHLNPESNSDRGTDGSDEDIGSGQETTVVANGTTVVQFRCSKLNCECVFATKKALKEHRRHAHGAKPFKCTHQGCGKAYGSRPGLKYHLTHAHRGDF